MTDTNKTRAIDTESLQRLLDQQMIADQLHCYARAMDRIDNTLGRSVFHEDATADYGEIYQGTGHGFVEWVSEMHRTLLTHAHQLGNILISIEGDRAGSEAYVSVEARFMDEDQRLIGLTSRGRYIDQWEKREDGVWRISHRRYIQEMDTSAPVTSSYATAGSRDGEDPSYKVLNLEAR